MFIVYQVSSLVYKLLVADGLYDLHKQFICSQQWKLWALQQSDDRMRHVFVSQCLLDLYH
jgi:hypothetical protein